MDPARLDRAFDALTRAARLSGAYRQVARALLRTLEGDSLGSDEEDRPSRGRRVDVLDVGTGRGDLLRYLRERLRRRGIAVRPVGGDLHPVALRLARRDSDGAPSLLRLSASRLPLADGSVDFVVSTITLHHLSRGAAARFLAEAHRVARRGWIVVDLRRSLPTRLLVRLLAETAWRSNPLPRHDGPISARRAFRTAEMRGLLEEVGLPGARVRPSLPCHLTVTGGELARRGAA